jgi:hypothetical protein
MAVIAHKDPSLPAPPPLPDGAGWIAALARLEPGAAEALVVLVRTLYPHDWLPDRVYRRVVTAYDRLAAASPAAEALIAQTLTRLDDGAGPPFAERSESYRLAALRAIEGTPGFVLLQRAAVRFLYDDIEVWSALGYEGASTHLGGYVDRGFDDPDWLEAAPGEA